jgi:uncharacterized membrane protein (DUF373 family)
MLQIEKIIEFLKKFERMIIICLIVMMIIVVSVATFELGWIIIDHIISPPLFLLLIPELLDIFGFFLLVLIGIELLETIKAYLIENVFHIQIVLEVALIAIARKVIIFDLNKFSGITILGTAALIVAVAAAYFAVRRNINGIRKSDKT